MRWSKSLIPTLRQVPADAVVPSHQLMLRAGLIQQVAAGSYTYLPLGWRVLHKVWRIIRQEMDRAGAIECFGPTLQPIEWWQATGRAEAFGDNLFVLTDRHGRRQALGPTHEEVFTMVVKTFIHSYRQLPVNLYHIQTKFRDEYRPRFGVLRSREFQMKDAYSFHLDLDCLDRTYRDMYDAYCRIFSRCGLDYRVVEAESGPIGGDASHEFMVPCDTGEDTILSDDTTHYAANMEKCQTGARPIALDGSPLGQMTDIQTPDCAAISDLCANWPKLAGSKLKPSNAVKSVLFAVRIRRGQQTDTACWQAMVRGDHEINTNKLRKIIEQQYADDDPAELEIALDLMPEEQVKQLGIPIGYIGPDLVFDLPRSDFTEQLRLVVDFDLLHHGFWVTGANRPGWHKKCFDWWRDFVRRFADDPDQAPETFDAATFEHICRTGRFIVADIRNAHAGDPSPRSGGAPLSEYKGLEVGHIFKLGTKYSQALDCSILDEKGETVYPLMGCYGIGVNRIIAAAIESSGGHDDAGIIWPMSIAPYHLVITPIKYVPGSAVADTADQLYDQLTDAGVEVLLDDRDERPGVKFKDADLIGIPLRLVIGEKTLAQGQVELKARDADQPELIAVEQAPARIGQIISERLAGLQSDLRR